MSAPGAGIPPAETPKPKLKINVSRSSSFAGDATPSSTLPSEGSRKVKLKIVSSQPPTPATEKPPAKTKAGRLTKPSQKLVESRKRPHEDDDEESLPLRISGNGPGSAPSKTTHSSAAAAAAAAAAAVAAATKIRIRAGQKSSSGMQVVLKPRGRPPHHPPGDGYDSEASDREIDPSIEEQFLLRMLPGEYCDYVRWCMDNGRIGIPRAQGGADMSLKFFDEESRRAVVTIKGQPLAAVMVDLPTITESMKTWDRKSLMKSADICQMLLVFQQVQTEEEAKKVPLPSMIDSHFRWPHGLTPPMHDCVNRRFAKTISRKEIEDKEAEVERLLMEDAKASSTKWEWVDERPVDDDDDPMGAGDEDAEGEMDDSMGFFGGEQQQQQQQGQGQGQEGGTQSQEGLLGSTAADGPIFGDDDNDDLEADLEAAFADEIMGDLPEGVTVTATGTQDGTSTPVLQVSIEDDESESEEDEDDDDDDDDDDEDLDEDERAQRDEEEGIKDIIHDMEKQLARREADLEKTQNKILKTRLENQIRQLRSEIELKKSSIGMEVD